MKIYRISLCRYISFILWVVATAFLLCGLSGCSRKKDALLELSPEYTTISENETVSENVDLTTNDLANDSAYDLTNDLANDLPGQQVSEPTVIYVHVCGAVNNPGVYMLAQGSRLYEAVAAAGGFRNDAEVGYANQAELLYDGCKVIIPTISEIEEYISGKMYASRWDALNQGTGQVVVTGNTNSGTAVAGGGSSVNAPVTGAVNTSSTGAVSAEGIVNINTATAQELQTLNGIGEVKSESIVAYRQENGNFACIEDIMNVSGIGQGTFDKIKSKICVN